MNRIIRIYIAFVVLTVVAGLIVLVWSQNTGIGAALGKLGRSDTEFAGTRNQLLLTSADPRPQLVRFILKRETRPRARLQAVSILEELSRRSPVVLDSTQIARMLADTSQPVRLATLRALETVDARTGIFAIADIFRTTRDSAIFQQSWITLKAAMAPFTIPLMDPASQTRACVDSCADMIARSPYGKGEYYPQLAPYYSARGDFERAARYSGARTYLDKWWAVGCWKNLKMTGFHTQYGPELRAFSPRDTFHAEDDSVVRWTPITNLSPISYFCWVDLCNIYGYITYKTAYLFTYVHSPVEQDAYLMFGSDDGVCMYVNDTLVYGHKVFRAANSDDDVVRVHLRKGVTRVMAKVLQDVGGWGFTCRVTDLNGNSLPGVVASFSDSLTTTSDVPCESRLLASDDGWDAIARQCDLSDSALAGALVAAARADTLRQDVRMRALRALAFVNDRRIAPAGEDVLLTLARAQMAGADTSSLFREAVHSLSAMRSIKALDIGEAARATSIPVLQADGDALVSAHCREVLATAVDSSARHSALAEIAALEPRDPWIALRIIASHEASGDTVGSSAARASLSMPWQWVSTVVPGLADTRVTRFLASVKMQSADMSTYAGARGSAGKRSVLHDVNPSMDPHGIVWHQFMDGGLPCPSDTEGCALFTAISSDREDSAYLCISLPIGHHAIFNGRDLGACLVDRPERYFLRNLCPEQPFAFDVTQYRVAVKKGINSIALVATGPCVDGMGMYFRVAFRDVRGNPVGCRGQVLQWGAVQAGSEAVR
jgi:hypothetical protein